MTWPPQPPENNPPPTESSTPKNFNSYYRPPGANSQETSNPTKQSPFGVAGIILAIAGILAEGFGFGYAVWLAFEAKGAQAPVSEDDTLALVGCAILAGIASHGLGLLVTVAGFFQANRKRTLIWISLAMNGLPALGMVGFILFGIAIG